GQRRHAQSENQQAARDQARLAKLFDHSANRPGLHESPDDPAEAKQDRVGRRRRVVVELEVALDQQPERALEASETERCQEKYRYEQADLWLGNSVPELLQPR